MDKRIKMGILLVAVSLTFSPLLTFATSLEEEKVGVNTQLKETELKVKDKEAKLTESNDKVKSFQTKVDELQGQINVYQFNIDKAQSDIESKQALIEKKEKESLERQEILDSRLREYYKNDMNSQVLNVLLNSESFSDLINNMKNLSKLMDIDKDLLTEIEEKKVRLNEENIALKKEMDKLNEDKEQIKNKKQEQVDSQKIFIEEKTKYEAEMKELKVLQEELKQKDNELEMKIKELSKQTNKGNNKATTGKFLTPAGGYISSDYGYRNHPLFGEVRFHTGVDFAASNNSEILAAENGDVSYTGVIDGYGNVVILNHYNGIQTFYAHCNSFIVNVGDKVYRGNPIAYVGSTGNSTGPHLHFEVRVNGNHTDPMKYL